MAVLSSTAFLVAFLALFAVPAPATSQEPYSPLIRRGMLRLTVQSEYLTFSSRYVNNGAATAINGLQPLSSLFSGTAGPTIFPTLKGFEEAVEEASATPYSANFGTLDAAVEKSSLRLPLEMDIGVFDWLTVGAVVPLVQNQTEFCFTLTRIRQASTRASARACPMNRWSLTFSPDSSNRLGATTRSARLHASRTPVPQAAKTQRPWPPTLVPSIPRLGLMYESGMSPLASSEAGLALQQRLAEFAGAFSAAAVTGTPGSVPLSEVPLTAEDLSALITDPRFGIVGSHPLEQWDGRFGRSGISRSGQTGVCLKPVTAGGHGTLRSGRGCACGCLREFRMIHPTSWTPERGDRQTDIELRGWMNGRRGALGLWADLRYGLQLQGTTERRVFDQSFALAPHNTLRRLSWNPGDYQFIELAPWYRQLRRLQFWPATGISERGETAFLLRPQPRRTVPTRLRRRIWSRSWRAARRHPANGPWAWLTTAAQPRSARRADRRAKQRSRRTPGPSKSASFTGTFSPAKAFRRPGRWKLVFGSSGDSGAVRASRSALLQPCPL